MFIYFNLLNTHTLKQQSALQGNNIKPQYLWNIALSKNNSERLAVIPCITTKLLGNQQHSL